ncbi:MAG: hypothetical protein M1832_001625 [Thelocarpon impressellum]|nr:MAG: hypothetical protein M1832_001625 [Thelocarpon impressellum]
MAEDSKIREFPDIDNKLTAPTKKSLFERQKAEAEAKRLREQAETAAVYEDFVKSFDDGDDALPSSGGVLSGRQHAGGDNSGSTRGGNLGGPPKRQVARGAPIGPGGGRGTTQGGGGVPFPSKGVGSLGAAPTLLSRKRTHDGFQRSHGLLAFEDGPLGPDDTKAAFQASEDEEERDYDGKTAERAASKPTLHLSSLPPGTSPAAIKAIFPSSLTVDAVRILPPTGPGSVERKSLSAIVTLTKDTPANEIDTAVNAMQNRYLGWGYTLSLSRHLSSAALNAGASVQSGTGPASALTSLPFGAKPVQVQMGPTGPMNRAPPPRGGFAPPSSYATNQQHGRGAPPVAVSVKPPADLKQLRLIHKTLEALLTHGPEFEALLMSRSEVQRGENWAWIWDSRSAGGVWYRWRLWQILSGAYGQRKGMAQYVFDGAAAWVPPKKGVVRFEYTTELDEFVSDTDYDSSEDEDSGNEDHYSRRQPRHNHGRLPPIETAENGANLDRGVVFLNPLKKAQLTHLLARLPTTNGRLRKGDVARVTAFAIEHAGEGADEVVDLIVANVERPFTYTSANPDRPKEQQQQDENGYDEDVGQARGETEDMSPSKLVALYVLSDILSCSSTSGVRHAWRYRQLFESTLKARQVFESLGRLEKTLKWGRLRAEKWKRSVGVVLSLWEGWCVFPQAAQEHFADAFVNPPLTAAEEAAFAATDASSGPGGAAGARSKWKTVDVTAKEAEEVEGVDGDLDGEPMDDNDLDGEPMDEDIVGEQMEEESMDGEPMDVAAETASGDGITLPAEPLSSTTEPQSKQGEGDNGPPRRRRPRAEDMFAASDEE